MKGSKGIHPLISTLLFAAFVAALAATGCDKQAGAGQAIEKVSEKEAADRAYLENLEGRTMAAIVQLQNVTVVFDPGLDMPVCWVWYRSGYGQNSVGSMSYIPCQIGRGRMAPSQSKALAEAEAKLGRSIP